MSRGWDRIQPFAASFFPPGADFSPTRAALTGGFGLSGPGALRAGSAPPSGAILTPYTLSAWSDRNIPVQNVFAHQLDWTVERITPTLLRRLTGCETGLRGPW